MPLGVISDTHNLLRPQVFTKLRGCDLIIHAGDVGNGEILQALAEIAPVHAVRGNTDCGALLTMLPLTRWVRIKQHNILVLHDLGTLNVAALPADTTAVVYGHSHLAAIHERNDVLYFNAGSAGPQRFLQPITLGKLLLNGDNRWQPQIITLSDADF